MKPKINTSYMTPVYNLELYLRLLPKVAKKLKQLKRKWKFEAIAFTGCSGAAVAYPLSFLTKTHLICVRKDKAHSNSKAEGATKVKRYLIVDDFICSGKTIRNIISVLKGKPVGILLYNAYGAKNIKYKNKIIPAMVIEPEYEDE